MVQQLTTAFLKLFENENNEIQITECLPYGM
jgi:hypothetical protein